MSFDISLIHALRDHTLAIPAFIQAAKAMPYRRRETFAAERLRPEQAHPLGEVLISEEASSGFSIAMTVGEDHVVAMVVDRGAGELIVAGRDAAGLEAVAKALVSALSDETDDIGNANMTFWASRYDEPVAATRRLELPTWDEIRGNYPAESCWQLDELMAAREPGLGRLILMHGPPGTGKTHVIRALAREWGDWCRVETITDPDLVSDNMNLETIASSPRTSETRPWRLLVLEDAGQLLAADARRMASESLSNLLNLTDGLFGETMRTMVLVTTNEPLVATHEAISRPGRCWKQIEIDALPGAEADAWLADHGAPDAGTGRSRTLAELFALRAGQLISSTSQRRVGF